MFKKFLNLFLVLALAYWIFSDGDVEEQIVELETEVRAVPVSNYDKNLEIYKKLLELDPNNARYRQKIATYTKNKKIAEETPSKESDPPLPQLNEAKDYKVMRRVDASIGRTRYVLNISSPDAKTFEERAHTALKAAIEIQKQTGANVVAARLFIYGLNEVTPLEVMPVAVARAEYSGDGKDWSGSGKLRNGNWEVMASSLQITEPQLAIAKIWEDNDQNFQIDDGQGGMQTDEKRLRKLIGKKLKMSESEVHTAIFEMIKEGAEGEYWPEK